MPTKKKQIEQTVYNKIVMSFNLEVLGTGQLRGNLPRNHNFFLSKP